jgi:hypothetical protein
VPLHIAVVIYVCENLLDSLEEGGCIITVNLCMHAWAAGNTCWLTVLEV